MDGTQITVAAVGAAALFSSTSLPAILSFHQGRRTHEIVSGNGHGSVDQMLERALHKLTLLEEAVFSLEERVEQGAVNLAAHTQSDERNFNSLSAQMSTEGFEVYMHGALDKIREQLTGLAGREALTLQEVQELRLLVRELADLREIIVEGVPEAGV